MKEQHVKAILESAPLGQLSEGELAQVSAHAKVCADCRRAYRAAQAASALLRERAAESFEPTPFFQTRVLAALRERRAEEALPALSRLWKSAGALVSSMAAAVVLLAAFSLVAPEMGLAPEADEEVAAAYEAEPALLAPADGAEEEIDFEQVFTTVYASGDSNE